MSTTGAVDTGNPYTYNGEYTDAATGEQYLRARYYDAQTGSFLTQDSYLGNLMEPLTANLYTYAENNPVNFDDPSGHGIFSWAKSKISSGINKVKKTVSNAVNKVKTTVSNVVNKAKAVVSSTVNKAKKAISNTVNRVKTTVSNTVNKVKNWASSTFQSSGGNGSSSRSGTGGNSSGSSSSQSLYEKAKSAGKSLFNWGSSKMKEAKNIATSWSESLEKTVKNFCTSAERIKNDVVEFVKNVDWKKVAIGVGTTLAIAGVTVLTGGSAIPVLAAAAIGSGSGAAMNGLIAAAIGSGSGAAMNGLIAAAQGGSAEDVAKAASDGFMWGAIGGSFGAGTTQILGQLAKAGSKAMSSPVVQRLVQGAADTVVETGETLAQGGKVTPTQLALSFVYNTASAGSGGNGTQTVNKLVNETTDEVVDEITDSVEDSIRREVRESGSETPSEIARSWQGSGKYPGIDEYTDVTVTKGTVLYRGEPNGTEYFTTLDAIEQSGRDATTIFEGLQVEKNPIHGYRGEMQGYLFNEDIASAYGITNANPQFGKGGLPQYYVPDVQDLISKGILTPVDNIKLYK